MNCVPVLSPGTHHANKSPRAIPGQVNSAGKRPVSASMKMRPTTKKENTLNFSRAGLRPNLAKQARNNPAVSTSTMRYRRAMRSPQWAQRPRSRTKLATGILRHHGMEAPHRRQCEPGETMDSSRGMRVMQTFRKLPETSPSSAAMHANNGSTNSLRQGYRKRSKSPSKVTSQRCIGGSSPTQFSSLRLTSRASGSNWCHPVSSCSRTFTRQQESVSAGS